MLQSSCQSSGSGQSRSDPVTFGGVDRGKPETLENVKIEVSLSYELVIGS